MWRDPDQRARRRGRAGDDADPRARDVVRRDRRGARHRRRRDRGERRLLAGRPPRALRRRRARDRVAAAPRARRPGAPGGARRGAGAALEDVDRVAVTQRPRARSARSSSGSRLRRRWPGRARLPLVPVDHLQGHVASLYLEPDPLEPPFVCLLASGGHTMLLDVRERGSFERARVDARRRCRRGVRQGRPPARARLPGRGGDRPAGARRAIPRRTPSRSRACPGSTSPSPGSRPRCSTPCASSTRRARAAARRPRRELPARDRPGARRAAARKRRQTGLDRVAVVGGVAANSELRAALPDARLRAARAVHGQRGHDRVGGALHAGPSRTRTILASMRTP